MVKQLENLLRTLSCNSFSIEDFFQALMNKVSKRRKKIEDFSTFNKDVEKSVHSFDDLGALIAIFHVIIRTKIRGVGRINNVFRVISRSTWFSWKQSLLRFLIWEKVRRTNSIGKCVTAEGKAAFNFIYSTNLWYSRRGSGLATSSGILVCGYPV